MASLVLTRSIEGDDPAVDCLLVGMALSRLYKMRTFSSPGFGKSFGTPKSKCCVKSALGVWIIPTANFDTSGGNMEVSFPFSPSLAVLTTGSERRLESVVLRFLSGSLFGKELDDDAHLSRPALSANRVPAKKDIPLDATITATAARLSD